MKQNWQQPVAGCCHFSLILFAESCDFLKLSLHLHITYKLRRMQKYSIELVEEHDAVNFYSIVIEGKELTELESFFDEFPIGCEYDREMDVIRFFQR